MFFASKPSDRHARTQVPQPLTDPIRMIRAYFNVPILSTTDDDERSTRAGGYAEHLRGRASLFVATE